MRTASLPRLLPAGLAIVLLAGCRAAASPAPTSSSTPSPTGTASATPSVAVSPAPTSGAAGTAEAAKAWLLLGRRGEPGLRLVLTTTGEAGMDLPLGAPRAKWDRVVTATPDDDTTIVADIVVQPGFGGPEVRVPGRWRLPTIGLDPTPTGRSIDGSTIALVEGAYDGSADASPSPRLSRFAIVEHHVADTRTGAGDAPLRLARIVELPGDFAYDALSPDGRILYVVEHLDATAGGRYQVRAVDVPTGVMRDAVIVDKTNPDERMAGTPIAQVRRPDGLVLTLYRGSEHPFIHALMAHEAWAVCIDLPAAGADHADAALDWDLAASPRGGSVFAVNATLGLAVDVDPAALAVRRSATIGATADAGGTAPAATDGIELAKFGHIDLGTVGRRTVVSADGSTLFAAGAGGIAVIGTKDLGVVRRDLPGSAIDGLGITPDGAVLFALLRGSGEIAAIATADGRSLGTVPGSGYDRLLAVAPW
jgi:hypothetical protein